MTCDHDDRCSECGVCHECASAALESAHDAIGTMQNEARDILVTLQNGDVEEAEAMLERFCGVSDA